MTRELQPVLISIAIFVGFVLARQLSEPIYMMIRWTIALPSTVIILLSLGPMRFLHGDHQFIWYFFDAAYIFGTVYLIWNRLHKKSPRDKEVAG